MEQGSEPAVGETMNEVQQLFDARGSANGTTTPRSSAWTHRRWIISARASGKQHWSRCHD